MGRLPEAVEGSKAHRPQELVVPGVMHDELRVDQAVNRRFGPRTDLSSCRKFIDHGIVSRHESPRRR
jgi:hypothetical protein